MKHIFTLLLLLLACLVRAQDFLYSQFYAVPMSLNAAATGHIETGNQRITTAYRAQWASPESGDGAYQGAWTSYEYRHCLKRNFWAVGGLVQAEGARFARYQQAQARLSGAFHYRLSRRGPSRQGLSKQGFYAAVGGGIGGLQQGAALGGLRYDHQFVSGTGYDPSRGSGENFADDNPNRWVTDLNAGAQVYHTTEGWGGGLAFLHLNRPQFSVLGQNNFLGIGLVAHWTHTFWLHESKRSALVVRGLYVRQSASGQNSRQWQGLGGVFWKMTGRSGGLLAPGCMLRTAGRERPVVGRGKASAALESVVPTVQLGNQRFRLGLSYDWNVQRIAAPSAGRMEVALMWNLGEEDRCVVCNEF